MKYKFQWWKLIAGYLLFFFFHEIYKLMNGNIIGTIFGEGFESIYTHMKMYFYTYLSLSAIDFFRRLPAALLFRARFVTEKLCSAPVQFAEIRHGRHGLNVEEEDLAKIFNVLVAHGDEIRRGSRFYTTEAQRHGGSQRMNRRCFWMTGG